MGTGGGFHAGAEEEAGVGRLIVGHVLPGDGEAILRVMHERVEAVLGGDRRGKNAELLVVGSAENDFFAPVAEEVDAESGGGFGAIVGGASFGGEQRILGFLFPIPF